MTTWFALTAIAQRHILGLSQGSLVTELSRPIMAMAAKLLSIGGSGFGPSPDEGIGFFNIGEQQ